jgi:hypothetical protein
MLHSEFQILKMKTKHQSLHPERSGCSVCRRRGGRPSLDLHHRNHLKQPRKNGDRKRP